MNDQTSQDASPLRVAIIGSGPSGFYAAEHLLRQDFPVQVDMFERLPTPFGLVRGGVAPDHAKIKSVTKVYDRTAARPNFAFYGDVEFGRDITLADLQAAYHAIVFATGAESDRALGIPGEDLPGSHAATEFVGWYNGHPDYKHHQFDLNTERAIVVGVGNVAVDVARILARTCDELVNTDIADYALEALNASHIREIIMIGRRGPAQAAFSPAELKELGELADADLIISEQDATPDSLSAQELAAAHDPESVKNVALMQQFAQRPPSGKSRRIVLRFLTSPIEIEGDGRVQSVTLVKNRLVARPDGLLKLEQTDETETVPAGLVFRSVGYKGVALPDVPFDPRSATIPNLEGRVLDATGGNPVPGLYAVGWIKRGPSGIIGTNKPDSIESMNSLITDFQGKNLPTPAEDKYFVRHLLDQRGIAWVSFSDWQTLDALELKHGENINRPRLKFTDVTAMRHALHKPDRNKAQC
jgi:ferredoxin--NADP+ reductase